MIDHVPLSPEGQVPPVEASIQHDVPLIERGVGFVGVGQSVETELINAPNTGEKVVDRASQLFAPVMVEKPEADAAPKNYDHLFDLNYDPKSYSVEKAAIRSSVNIRASTTEESVNAAAKLLSTASNTESKLLGMIRDDPAVKDRVTSNEAITEIIRTNAALRLKLGAYFLDKFYKPQVYSKLPERVVRNRQKSPGASGYEGIPTVTSQEYSAMLALSMLDGTFKQAKADAEYDGTGSHGQHRHAARLLLSQ